MKTVPHNVWEGCLVRHAQQTRAIPIPTCQNMWHGRVASCELLLAAPLRLILSGARGAGMRGIPLVVRCEP